MTPRVPLTAEDLNAEHNAMMSWATVLYSASRDEVDARDLEVFRVPIAEGLVGEWIEAGRPRVRPSWGAQ